MALAFVPVDDVITAFLALLDLSNDYPELDDVFAYFEDTYIGRAHGERRLRPRYSIQCWNVYDRVIFHLPHTQCNRRLASCVSKFYRLQSPNCL